MNQFNLHWHIIVLNAGASEMQPLTGFSFQMLSRPVDNHATKRPQFTIMIRSGFSIEEPLPEGAVQLARFQMEQLDEGHKLLLSALHQGLEIKVED